MKQSILNRIQALGGDISKVKGTSLQEDLLSITFNTVLYEKPEDTPWAKADEEEPIYGLGEWVDTHFKLYKSDKKAFYDKMIAEFYCLTEEPRGQHFWVANLFTPFKEGTADYEEWYDDFSEEEFVDLTEITKLTSNKTPDFIQLFYTYSYPDHLYIALSDPNPENPTLFGTDHEVFFSEVDNMGCLEDYLNTLMTPEELIDVVEKALVDYKP
ncbi:hypothetical protein [Capnocytophaga sp. oral taxon 878]|uniref:hypothetical protein n=1 Tax=Capnocytophaga sp. oral taxon 878 TaxID=1316596 RepID=UPI000D023044|nr:hypothetical protein [Capnocytophaga sp. oral taxon 878]AVM49503.1 hypothetical protein C4H12_02925 [Capnocytophaga sp. oral taxon 878]